MRHNHMGHNYKQKVSGALEPAFEAAEHSGDERRRDELAWSKAASKVYLGYI